MERIVGDVRQGLVLLMAAVGVVLMVLCVNLANLSLARAAGRARESAIRTALGASRGRLVRQSLVESTLLALLGGALGVTLAYLGVRALLAAAPVDMPRLDEVTLDVRVLLFALGISLVTGLVFGALPALRSARSAPFETLKSGSRSNTEGRGGLRVRNLLVSLEVGLSAALLVTAGLLDGEFRARDDGGQGLQRGARAGDERLAARREISQACASARSSSTACCRRRRRCRACRMPPWFPRCR